MSAVGRLGAAIDQLISLPYRIEISRLLPAIGKRAQAQPATVLTLAGTAGQRVAVRAAPTVTWVAR
jgi:hypothetical protein